MLAASAPVDSVPEVALAPDQSPEATQDVASVEDQLSIAAFPLVIDPGLTASDTFGAGSTVTVTDALALPPAPAQVSE